MTKAVTIVIPTACEAARRDSLWQAIESVLDQKGVEKKLVVVVNGNRFDSILLEQLRSDPRLETVYQQQPGAPRACARGRSMVATEFFGFLDDDDELLPDALALRCQEFESCPEADFVATNGYRGNTGEVAVNHVERIQSDPMEALLERNWLASCGGLFRTTTVRQTYFDSMPDYLEWTSLAFRMLADGLRVSFVDRCTFRINESPVSLSKSSAYRTAVAGVLEGLLALRSTPVVKSKLRRMLVEAHHDLSVACLDQGQKRDAWRYHLKCLRGPTGFRYLLYTRRLVL